MRRVTAVRFRSATSNTIDMRHTVIAAGLLVGCFHPCRLSCRCAALRQRPPDGAMHPYGTWRRYAALQHSGKTRSWSRSGWIIPQQSRRRVGTGEIGSDHRQFLRIVYIYPDASSAVRCDARHLDVGWGYGSSFEIAMRLMLDCLLVSPLSIVIVLVLLSRGPPGLSLRRL